MTETPAADDVRLAQLRELLNRWDPLGTADVVDDEYDCLLLPLRDRLAAGTTRAALAGYVRTELRDHFGIDQERHDPDALAAELHAWWHRRPAPGGGDAG